LSLKKALGPFPGSLELIQDKGGIQEHEMYRTFNMGMDLPCGFTQGCRRRGNLFAFSKNKIVCIGEVIQDPKHKVIFR